MAKIESERAEKMRAESLARIRNADVDENEEAMARNMSYVGKISPAELDF